MKNLDEIDALILQELLQDGRKSFAAIANNLKITKELVRKRYIDMQKTGIITGATTQFNYPCFGYESVATITLSANSENVDKVLENLLGKPDVYAKKVYNSSFNITVITTFKSLRDLDNIKASLRSDLVNSLRIHLWTDVRNTPEHITFGFQTEKFTLSINQKTSVLLSHEKTDLKIDDIDNQIINTLNINGRATFNEIAKKAGTSIDTVARRYTRLVKQGLIKVIIQINPNLVGYQALATFFISIHSEDNVKSVIDELAKIPNVSYIARLAGNPEVQLAILLRGLDDFIQINKKLLNNPGIEKIEVGLREAPTAWPSPKQFITTF